MKQIFLIIVLLILMTGCGSKKIICHYEIKNKNQNYEANIIYTILHNRGYVNKVLIDEKYISKDENVIDYYDKYLYMTYMNLNEQYGYVSINKKSIRNGVQYEVSIDFKKTSVKEMKKNNYIEKEYIKNNKVRLTGLTTMYEKKGAVCK